MTKEELDAEARKKSLSYNTKYAEDRVLDDMLSRPQDFIDGAIAGMVDLLRKKAYRDGLIDGAEFGYNKANEWHFVKDEGTPKVEGHYLVCLRNKNKDIFDCWIYYDKDVGWYSMKVRIKDIYAWKEIVLPELKEIE